MTNTKMPSAIERITLNAATFSGVTVEPTLINFFYGNNGTGKSTIARVIDPDDKDYGQPTDLTWQEGKSAGSYDVLVYNQEFVARNFRSYGDVKGIFTVGEENIKTKELIAEKTALQAEQEKQNTSNGTAKDAKEKERNKLLSDFQETCWDKAKTIREEFDGTQGGFKRKAQFADEVLRITNPTSYEVGDLRILYETAFNKKAAPYREFQPTGATVRLRSTPGGNELLSKPITSSSTTEFADFLRRVKAIDWVRRGHKEYTASAEGHCPYCQRVLPDDFEAQLAACEDEQYKADLEALRLFQEAYVSDMRGFLDVLNENIQHELYPKFDLTEYRDKLALLEKTIESNIQIIANKLNEPASVFTIENVKPLRDEINAIIEKYNEPVQAHNAILLDTKAKADCIAKVWALIAFILKDDVDAYLAKRKALDDEIAALAKLISDGGKAWKKLEDDIIDLNKDITSALPTIDKMNKILKESGFQGFTLREKRGQKGTYEVMRPDDTVAKKLSEGELNFIAFLYFYHLVRGSHDASEKNKDKIVVIDDPASSVDSAVLFIVSTLVREMIGVCFNNAEYREHEREVEGDYIKQIFVLTHNVYFHREVTYNQARRFHCVSFFVVNKANNDSTVRPCVRPSLTAPTEQENFNPVQNSYAALWNEFKEVDSSISTMSVIRRILEYYFMQLCGYDGVNIRDRVLDDHKDCFVDKFPDGSPDYTKFHLVSAMLAYINASTVGFIDGLNYIDEYPEVQPYKETFKLLFKVLEQEQHYKLMMGESA